jgi:LmbE family N-acetylglucosaminyl deacetylase
MEHWFIPYEPAALPAAQRVLVLAPHPDDEVFGCGGAAALLARRGAAVRVVILTDGAGLAGSESEREAIVAQRRQESIAASAVLGLAEPVFWGLPDRSLANQSGLSERIDALLTDVDLVLAPNLTEIHPDHVSTARALLNAIRSCVTAEAALPELLLYEVGALSAPDCLIDVTSVWPLKRQAMQCFASQLVLQDYARHIEGLNAFRTYTLGPEVSHAEAYRRISPEDLRNADLDALIADARLQGQPALKVAALLQTAEAEVEQTRQLYWAATSRGDALQAENQAVKAEKVEIRDFFELQVNSMQRTIDAMLNSHSWRLTRPVRWLSGLLRRVFARGS